MPMGRPVQGSMNTPNIDYYTRVKVLFAELYLKYKLEPPKSNGLNVCIEQDIWKFYTQKLTHKLNIEKNVLSKKKRQTLMPAATV